MIIDNFQKIIDGCFVVEGVSYIGRPKSKTAVFVSKKVDFLIHSLESVNDCLVFADIGINIPEIIESKHFIYYSYFPQLDYSKYVCNRFKSIIEKDRIDTYSLVNNGIYIGKNVKIGENVIIEPGCVFGHDVTIGSNTWVKANVIIKHATIGDNCILGEGTVIGADGFNHIRDEKNDWSLIPSLGGVCIGDNVEIGVNNCIARGTADNTIVADNVKTDSLVYIGHDSSVGRNVEIAAGVVIAGFVIIDDDVVMGLNVSVRNRVNISEGSLVGMGGVVVNSIAENSVVFGNPATVHMRD